MGDPAVGPRAGSARSGSWRQDPLYVDPDGGNYRLQATSPQKQQGLVCAPGGLTRTDLDGEDRVERVPGQGAFLTAGAYGFAEVPPGPGQVLLGTDGVDTLEGSTGNDVACGYGEDDDFRGRPGNDVAFGANDDDELLGGTGDDFLYGENGMDVLTGGPGSDYLVGGNDFDTINSADGVGGNDQLFGGPGVDSCHPDSGDQVDGC